jgi:hypothetical protein
VAATEVATATEMAAAEATAAMATTASSAASRIGRADSGSRHHQASDARESQCLKGSIHCFLSISEISLENASRRRLSDAGVTLGVNPNARWAVAELRGGANQKSQCGAMDFRAVSSLGKLQKLNEIGLSGAFFTHM